MHLATFVLLQTISTSRHNDEHNDNDDNDTYLSNFYIDMSWLFCTATFLADFSNLATLWGAPQLQVQSDNEDVDDDEIEINQSLL